MRWVLGSLLLMNMGYLAWQLYLPTAVPERSEAKELAGVPMLMTMNEVLQQKQERAQVTNQGGGQKEAAPQQVVQAESVPAQVAQEQATPDPVSPEPVPSEAIAQKTVSQAQPAQNKTEASEPQPEVAREVLPLACYSVGAFSSASDVKIVGRRMEKKGVSSQQRANTAKIRTGFWVYIRESRNRRDARDILHELKEKGVKDTLLISESKDRVISVGVYRGEIMATKRQQEIAALGYLVNLEARYRSQPQYWLDVDLWKQTELPKGLAKEVLRGYPDIKFEKRDCRQ